MAFKGWMESDNDFFVAPNVRPFRIAGLRKHAQNIVYLIPKQCDYNGNPISFFK